MTHDEQTIEDLKKELKEYASGNKVPSFGDTLQECNTVVTRSILGAFGLSAFADKQGGNVTTIHNFKQGITATDADYQKYLQYNTPYDSNSTRQPYLPKQAKNREKRIKSDEPIISGYTGKELPHDGQAQLEHIVSVGEIESMPENFLFLSEDGRVELAYSDKNLTMLESAINQSKGAIPLKEWLDKKSPGQTETNAERFGIDIERALKADKEARDEIYRLQRKLAAQKYTSELVETGLRQGVMLGTREVLVVILIEFNDEAVDCIRRIMDKYRNGDLSFEDVIEECKSALSSVKERVLAKYDELISVFFTGLGSGFLSNLLVFLINTFITTARKVVIIVRESVYALIRTGQILCSDMSEEEKRKAASDVLISSMTICLTALLAESLKKYLKAIPYADEISQAISAILVGVSIVLVSYYFLSLQAELTAATAAVALTADATVQAIDTAQEQTRNRVERRKRLDDSTRSIKNLRF